jgi:hypothetical protein
LRSFDFDFDWAGFIFCTIIGDCDGNASQSGPTFSGPNFSGPKILAGVGPEWFKKSCHTGHNFSGPQKKLTDGTNLTGFGRLWGGHTS